MLLRTLLLLALLLSFAGASAQSSSAIHPVRMAALPSGAALDVTAAEHTSTLLDALVRGDRRPLLDAVAAHRADRAAADFGQYLDALTAEIGAIRAHRLVRVQAHDRAATVVLAAVEGEEGTDVLRFVWRNGDLVLLNRGGR